MLAIVSDAANRIYNTDAKRVEGKVNVHIVPHSHWWVLDLGTAAGPRGGGKGGAREL